MNSSNNAGVTRRDFLKASGAAAVLAGAGTGLPEELMAQAPAGGPSRPPNILFLFADQHRFDWLGTTSGLEVRTPNIDALAARGIRFSNAITASPLCAPSRACVALGLEYDRTHVPLNDADMPLDMINVYQVLRQAGYYMGGCGKFDLQKGTGKLGLDGKSRLKEWGFDTGIDSEGKQALGALNAEGQARGPYGTYLLKENLWHTYQQDYKHRTGKHAFTNIMVNPIPDEAYNDNWVSRNGWALLEEMPHDRPWFIQVNWPGPHPPFDSTATMEAWTAGRNYPQPFGNTEEPPEKHEAIRRDYTAEVENIDRWVGAYMEKLRERGELDNTIVLYSSDHGEMLGVHNRWGKQVPYHPSLSIPLIFAGPGIPGNRVSHAPVTILDLAATWIDYAGATVPSTMDSQSMRPLIEGRSERHREVVRSGLSSWRLAYDGRYKLIRGFNTLMKKGQGEGANDASTGVPLLLFDLQSDPDESVNLAEKMPEVVARLEKHLPKVG